MFVEDTRKLKSDYDLLTSTTYVTVITPLQIYFLYVGIYEPKYITMESQIILSLILKKVLA